MVKTERVSFFHVLLVFLVVFFNLYSFPLSYSVVVDMVVLLCVLPHVGVMKTKGNRAIRNIVFSAFLLGVYTLLVCILNGSTSIYTLGKPVRFVFALIVFSLLSARFFKYTLKEIVIALILAIGVHLMLVYLEFFIPTLKPLVYAYLDADKEDIVFLPLRAFGLCSSFDNAGMILCMFEVLLWLISREKNSALLFLLCILDYVGCFMVGRTAMLVSTVFMIMIIISYAKRNKAFLFFFIIPAFVIGGSYVYNIAQDVLSNNVIGDSYRGESQEKLTGEMLYLPDSFMGSLFGTGEPAPSSDIGYVNQIFMVGIIGLIWILSLYYQTYIYIRKVRRNNKVIALFLTLVLLLLLAFNYKLSFLYSRSVSDVYFMLVFILMRKTVGENKLITYRA